MDEHIIPEGVNRLAFFTYSIEWTRDRIDLFLEDIKQIDGVISNLENKERVVVQGQTLLSVIRALRSDDVQEKIYWLKFEKEERMKRVRRLEGSLQRDMLELTRLRQAQILVDKASLLAADFSEGFDAINPGKASSA